MDIAIQAATIQKEAIMDVTIICKNDRCFEVVPASKGSGRKREFCNEKCRKRHNQRLAYKRATTGRSFMGLRGLTTEGYPQVHRKKSLTTATAEARVKEHGENCGASGEWCPAKLRDAYNTKKLCLVRAVFTDDWLELMYSAEGKVREREMTTDEGMWIDDFKAMLEKAGHTTESIDLIKTKRIADEHEAFDRAGGGRTLEEFERVETQSS